MTEALPFDAVITLRGKGKPDGATLMRNTLKRDLY
jgi:hypothetical protein